MNADELSRFITRQNKRITELESIKVMLEKTRLDTLYPSDFQLWLYCSELEKKVEQFLSDEREELKRTIEEEK